MRLRNISFFALALASVHAVADPMVESKVPNCSYQKLIVNVPSTIELVASGDSHGLVSGLESEINKLAYGCSDNTLRISTQDKALIETGFKFELTNGAIAKLVSNGSSVINITKLSQKEFELIANGSGKYSVTGKVENLDVKLNGSGKIELSNLVTQHGTAKVNGSGFIRVMATLSLKAKVNGIGRIEYSGSPEQLETSLNGKGSIIEAQSTTKI